MEKFIESLEKAKKALRTADHMTYMTYPLVKEKRLLLKILEDISLAIVNAINAILQYEYYFKRIQLYRDATENFNIFKEKCSKRYDINENQINKLVEVLRLNKEHKKSPFEFVRKDKIVIMSNNLKTDFITIEKMKDFLIEAKDLLRKADILIKK